MVPKVFLLDSNFESRRLLDELFVAHEMETLRFASSEQFLCMTKERPRGCIVMDLLLRDIPGLEVLQTIRTERQWSTPTIILTAESKVSLCVSAFQKGADDFIQKPVESPQLVEKVRNCFAIDKERLGHELRVQKALENLASLTDAERRVLEHLFAGKSMNEMADLFHTRFQAVAALRRTMMRKLGVDGDVPLTHWIIDHGLESELDKCCSPV